MVWRDLKDVCVNKANGIYYDCINRYEDIWLSVMFTNRKSLVSGCVIYRFNDLFLSRKNFVPVSLSA